MNMAIKNIRYLLVTAITMITTSSCFGDGVAFSGRDYSSLRPISQETQQVLISHDNGIEKMLITVALPLNLKDSAVWIFPVPGKPENVKIDLADSFPRFFGRNYLMQVYNYIGGVVSVQFSFLLFPFNCVLMPTLSKAREVGGVQIYEEVEKWGIHTETITADSLDSLAKYLNEKKTGIDSEQLKAFEGYLSDKYVLVVSWLSSTEELCNQFPEYEKEHGQSGQRWPCLYVEFPSEKAFYPMRPTATYGTMPLALRIVVLGCVEAHGLEGFTQLLRKGFYKQQSVPIGMPEGFIRDFENQKGQYTAFVWKGKANVFTDDLWFTPVNSKGLRYAEIIAPVLENGYVFVTLTICLIFAISYISAGIAGLLLFRMWRGYAFLGLANLFGIIGIWVASHFINGRVRGRFNDKSRSYGRASFLLVFAVVYILLSCGIMGICAGIGKILGL
jgi:hypothetical protein